MIAGIDLGGTKVRVALARSDGRILSSRRTRPDIIRRPARLAEWVAEQVARRSDRQSLRQAAIGAPGPIDTVNGILVNPPNLAGWKDVPLVSLLSRALGCPVHLQNDANLAGLGEFHQGAGRGSRTMVYVTWSPAVGGALIPDGPAFSGAPGPDGA